MDLDGRLRIKWVPTSSFSHAFSAFANTKTGTVQQAKCPAPALITDHASHRSVNYPLLGATLRLTTATRKAFETCSSDSKRSLSLVMHKTRAARTEHTELKRVSRQTCLSPLRYTASFVSR